MLSLVIPLLYLGVLFAILFKMRMKTANTLAGGIAIIAYMNMAYNLAYMQYDFKWGVLLGVHFMAFIIINIAVYEEVSCKKTGTAWGNLKDIILDTLFEVKQMFPKTECKDLDAKVGYIKSFLKTLPVYDMNKIEEDLEVGYEPAFIFIEAISDRTNLDIETIGDSYYIYMYCRYIRNRATLPELIIDPQYAYLYCKNIKDIPVVRDNITSPKWAYAYCKTIKDDPEVREWMLSDEDWQNQYDFDDIKIS